MNMKLINEGEVTLDSEEGAYMSISPGRLIMKRDGFIMLFDDTGFHLKFGSGAEIKLKFE